MSRKKGLFQQYVIIFIIFLVLGLLYSPLVHAQYWTAMPPYNLLWPLWSPALSPVDTITGLATPLLTELTKSTILPVHPALVWDPVKTYAYSIYNIPWVLGGGLLWFNWLFGLNPFPPPYLVDEVTVAPLPIALPLGYGALPPLDPRDELPNILGGNLTYLFQYPPFIYGTSLSSLLTASDIWGLTL
jgi:hypothetical protein